MLLVMILSMAVIHTHRLENTMGQIYQNNLGSMALSLSGKLYIVLVVTFFFGIATQLWITHRICGALINFTNTFKRIFDGDLDRKINLRKGDLLEKEADQFNRMMEKIARQFAALETDNEKLRLKIKTLSECRTEV